MGKTLLHKKDIGQPMKCWLNFKTKLNFYEMTVMKLIKPVTKMKIQATIFKIGCLAKKKIKLHQNITIRFLSLYSLSQI